MKQPYLNSLMTSLLAEPSLSTAGYADAVVDETIVETRLFLRDPADADSDVLFTREVEKNAGGDILSISAWALANEPTITDVTTDQGDNTTVALSGTTTLTITGSNFGIVSGDIQVHLYVRQKDRIDCITPTPYKNRLRIPAELVTVADDEIVATVTLSSLWGYNPGPGDCEVLVFHTKRLLISDEFSLTVL